MTRFPHPRIASRRDGSAWIVRSAVSSTTVLPEFEAGRRVSALSICSDRDARGLLGTIRTHYRRERRF